MRLAAERVLKMCTAGSEDGGKGHEPRNIGMQLSMLKRHRKFLLSDPPEEISLPIT